MSLFISLLGGLSVKVYDDLNDNIMLRKFRNETFMEILKGFHFIQVTATSIEEPLFFIIYYVTNLLNALAGEGFTQPYEHSVLYSFMLLFIIIDYKKLTKVSLLDTLMVLSMGFLMVVEPIIMCYFFENSEFSFVKLISRIYCLLCSGMCCFMSESMALKHLFASFGGYFIFSVFAQYYSLITTKEEEDLKEQIKEELKEGLKEVEELKEGKEKEIEIKDEEEK